MAVALVAPFSVLDPSAAGGLNLTPAALFRGPGTTPVTDLPGLWGWLATDSVSAGKAAGGGPSPPLLSSGDSDLVGCPSVSHMGTTLHHTAGPADGPESRLENPAGRPVGRDGFCVHMAGCPSQ